ncbi:MAG: hypothetical protein ACQKBT_08590, partial [Puniceicoccales bacterium]
MNSKTIQILLAILCIQISTLGSTVILNEYNAVADEDQIDEGNGADHFFGTIDGNGGDWLELVVVGDGTAGSTVDMRGWTIELYENNDGASSFKLSQDAYWAAVPAGTILTFIENDTAGGGLDTEVNREDRLNSEGWAWTNVYLGDATLIDTNNSDSDIHLSHSDAEITINNASASVIFGPAGEAIADEGVNSEEVLALQVNPSTAIIPADPGFNDISSSSFGAPNDLEGGSGSQSFLAFRIAGPAPSFSTPIANAEILTGEEFTTSTTATDANGGALSITLA